MRILILSIIHKTEKGEYRFSSKETKEFLEVETLYDRILLNELRYMILENLNEINASDIGYKESQKGCFLNTERMNKFKIANPENEMQHNKN